MPKKKQKNLSDYPLIRRGLGQVSLCFIILGLLFQIDLLYVLGWAFGVIWLYRYQKVHPKARILWALMILLLIVLAIYAVIADVRKFS